MTSAPFEVAPMSLIGNAVCGASSDRL